MKPFLSEEEEKQIKKRIKVKMTSKGQGIFARQDFAVEEVLGEVTGEVMSVDHGSNYCMDLEGKANLEPAWPFRLLNHSCEPNCELMLWKYRQVKGKKIRRLWVSAIRDIKAGEELTIDYAWPADAAVRCLCGASTCRGWVVDKNELRKLYRMGVRRKVPSLESTQSA